MRFATLGILTAIFGGLYFASLDSSFELARNAVVMILGITTCAFGFAAASQLANLRGESQALRASLATRENEKRQLEAARKSLEVEVRMQREAAERTLSDLARINASLEKTRQEALEQIGAARLEAKAAATKASDEDIVSFLGLLQQKGRFLDFLMDDVTKYPDAQIGAAARVVHQGCAGVVREYFDIAPVHAGQEGGSLTLGQDYDAHEYRLLGRVTGEPPFRGRVLHRGWKTTGVHLPEKVETNHTSKLSSRGIIAPAEVELS